MDTEPDVRVIGTRHGEKLFETLATREELRRAEDQGDFYRVSVDARVALVEVLAVVEVAGEAATDDYHSHNTERLDVDQVVHLLHSQPGFRALLAAG